MSVDLHLWIEIRGYDASRVEEIRAAAWQVIEPESVADEFPPLAEMIDGVGHLLTAPPAKASI